MSAASWIVVGVAVAYLAACLVLGTWSSRGGEATTVGYVAGDRSLGLLLLYFITGATIFSAFAFLGLPGWAYSRGAAAFYILGYGALGFVPFYFLGPRAARVGKARGYVTQAQMLARRFASPPLAAVMALVSAVAFVPYLALQMKGAGMVLSTMSGGAVPEALGAALVYGVVTLYVLKSGVLGVGWTNTFQGIFMIALAWGLGLYLPTLRHGGVGAMFDHLAEARPELLTAPGLTSGGEPWHWGEYSSAIVVSIIGFSAWPHLFMKAFTAKSVDTIRRTVVLYPTFQVFLLPLFLIGFAGVGFEPPPEAPDRILPHLLMELDLSPWLVGLFCAGALAASMSSGDAMVHAVASITVRDGWVTALSRRLTPERELAAIRALVVVYMLAAYAVAVVYEGSLVFLLLTAYGAVVQFMPLLVAALYWPRATGPGALAGLLGGAALTTLFVAWPDLRPWPLHAGLYGVALDVLLLVVVSRLTTPTPGAEAFVAEAAGRDAPSAPAASAR
ncbi:MAG TPA: sodium:solute symporter family protein [Sandaracinaceae bacterium LLY-WYZ-13_1]|nr:sodium:solute symporter family protein [Sandaracinaceae bacterium LLY-WYZ-13_1]